MLCPTAWLTAYRGTQPSTALHIDRIACCVLYDLLLAELISATIHERILADYRKHQVTGDLSKIDFGSSPELANEQDDSKECGSPLAHPWL